MPGPAEDPTGEGVTVTTAPGEAGAAALGADGDNVETRAAAAGEDHKTTKEEAVEVINGEHEDGAWAAWTILTSRPRNLRRRRAKIDQ